MPLEWYKRFFETALRLRMNMVAPYTRVHRRFEVQKLASDWGLYYTSHHYDILVSNPFGLERFNLAAERGVKPVYDWFTNREGMLNFWRGGVLENRSLDVIWPVGMRGTQDRPSTFPPGTTDDQKAATFREVINEQVKMTRELVPKDKPPIFHFTMYSEMLPQYQRNPAAFDLPSDVIVVWPDDNDGHMRALPSELGRWKHGVYYHLAYLGGNLTKQLTHTVGPATVATEFEKIVKAGATEYMLVNMSEVREYIMCGTHDRGYHMGCSGDLRPVQCSRSLHRLVVARVFPRGRFRRRDRVPQILRSSFYAGQALDRAQCHRGVALSPLPQSFRPIL